MLLPQGPLRQALYERLTTELSVDVVVQRQSEEAVQAPLILIVTPSSTPRGDIKEDTGYELTQRIRIHTQYPKGQADLSEREEIADAVQTALDAAPLQVDGHNILHLPTPDITPQEYDLGAQQAYDLLLDYNLLTQHIG